MIEATKFTTEDARNILLLAGDCLRSRKIDVRTANRINKAANASSRPRAPDCGPSMRMSPPDAKFQRPLPSCAKLRRCSRACLNCGTPRRGRSRQRI